MQLAFNSSSVPLQGEPFSAPFKENLVVDISLLIIYSLRFCLLNFLTGKADDIFQTLSIPFEFHTSYSLATYADLDRLDK